MSDTPETNAAEERCIKTGFKTGYVDVEFACKLERERDKARDTVLRLRKQRAIARNFGEQMERERDHIRVALEEIASLDTSQDASPQQCEAVLIAMNALKK
jgi:hypothetical protein